MDGMFTSPLENLAVIKIKRRTPPDSSSGGFLCGRPLGEASAIQLDRFLSGPLSLLLGEFDRGVQLIFPALDAFEFSHQVR